jgi:hypothetical protein
MWPATGWNVTLPLPLLMSGERPNLTFVILQDHKLISKMYWQMALCATCWSLCVYLVAT